MGKLYAVNELKAVLPQRYPMLMLDRAEQESADRVVGLKNLTMNELFFQGHFPGKPIMPGVLQVEAMKQAAELLARPELDPAGAQDVYMKLVEKVKFRKPNLPGDRVKVEADVLERRAGEMVFATKATNNSGVTCEAVMTLAVRAKGQPSAMPALFGANDKSDASPMDITGLTKLMPHRYPFLFIDYLSQVEGDKIVAIKNLSINEEMFVQREDGYYVLPESVQCEIIAQSGCACVLSRPENAGKIGLFMSIDRAEAFAPVYPGDQLYCEIVLPPAKSRFGKGTGRILVEGNVVFEITLMFAIVEA